jgi:hypothetical protein
MTGDTVKMALQRQIELDFPDGTSSSWPGGWPDEIEAALIDAVFSIRARYGSPGTGVRAVVERWRNERGAQQKLDDLEALASPSGRRLSEVAANNGRTGGSLKSDVVVLVARRLLDVGVGRAHDLFDEDTRVAAKEAYTSVSGLGWVTWSYLLMLIGVPDVKADVHIRSYVARALGEPVVSASEAHRLLSAVESPFSSVIHLDHAVWQLEREHQTE